MPKQNTTKLRNFLLLSPLKFAFIAFLFSFLAVLIYNLLLHTHPASVLFSMIAIAIITAGVIQVRHLPRITFNRQDFVATHIAQTLALVASFLAIVFLLPRFNIYGPVPNTVSILCYVGISIICLYAIGLLIANFYIKFRRISDMNIPLLHTLFTMPFGFSALWVPGYFLDIPKSKKSSIATPDKYGHIISKIVARPLYLAMAFALITLLSGFIFGIRPVLLTFALSLGFGIWAIGNRNTKTEISKHYTISAIIVNICIWIALLTFAFSASPITNDVQINISDTEQTTEQQPQQ